jgi:hypothetical protein
MSAQHTSGNLFVREFSNNHQGTFGIRRRVLLKRKENCLDALGRSIYAKSNLWREQPLGGNDIYFAIPLQKSQIPYREWMRGEIRLHVAANHPIMIGDIDSPYAGFTNGALKR